MNRPPEFHEDASFQIFAKGGLVTLSVIASKTKWDYTMSRRDAAALAKALTEAVEEMPESDQ